MATKFVVGKGSVVSVSTDGGTTWTPIKQVKSANYPDQKSDYDDITNMDSPGAYREWAPTLLDAGTVGLQGVFDPADAGQLAVRASFAAQTLLMYKHVFPKATDQTTTGFTRTWSAYVSNAPLDAQFDKASTFSASLKVSGPFTDVAGT